MEMHERHAAPQAPRHIVEVLAVERVVDRQRRRGGRASGAGGGVARLCGVRASGAAASSSGWGRGGREGVVAEGLAGRQAGCGRRAAA